jgi:hypothetical protein
LEGYRPGIDPEIMYFRQRTTEETPDVPGTVPPIDLPDDFRIPFDIGEFAGLAGLTDGMVSGDMPMSDIQEMAMQVTEQKIPRKGRKRDRDYGVEAFQQLRQEALAAVSESEPQTEGEIVGEGGGMDDMIGGTIAGQQPVALSPGEYVVPADVVSSIGDGSTDAGVEQLDGMLDRVRMEKTGTTKQPDAISAKMGGMLPA